MQVMRSFLHKLPAFLAALTLALTLVVSPLAALAGTTGQIDGTVVDATTGAPVAGAQVVAASPSDHRATTTDAKGFYALQALNADTYSLSVNATGYNPQSLPGVTVFQDQTNRQDVKLSKSLKTIATVSSKGGSLVKPDQTEDSYNVSGAQLNAISLGNNLHKTLYQYIAAIPGVTGSGFPAQPRIHGGDVSDIAYEFDGIPINERITGLFTTNLSNVGIANIEVYTGGLGASQSSSGLGIINTVVKTGTYPDTAVLSIAGSPVYRNAYETFEYGGSTPDRRFSWYLSADITNAMNGFDSGQTYPALTVEQDNGPGPVKTTDLIGNFHYKPDNKNDIQFLIQNGLGDFIYSYGFQRQPGEPVPLTAVPCAGAAANPIHSGAGSTWTGGIGGTAPDGAACPVGLAFGTANTQVGGGNIWHHYSGIGKLQWNHIINDHSFFALRVAENFNQYIFDQPIVDANIPYIENSSAFSVPGCPALPYYPGTPIQASSNGKICAQESNWLSTGYYQDRRSNMYLASLDYTDDISENAEVQAGIQQEYDNNVDAVYYTTFFNPNGSWPGVNFTSTYPSHVPAAYVQGQFTMHKWRFSPGLKYQRMYYDYPDGGTSVGIWNPTFSLNYQADPRDVFIGSYTNTNTFAGTQYVYRDEPQSALNGYGNNTPYCGPTSSNGCGFQPDPTIYHSTNLLWEHQLNPTTSFKIGPYYYETSNLYENYTPYTCTPTGPSTQNCIATGPAVPYNGGFRKSFGAELGVYHVDSHPVGVSYWLTGTYDNFWTNSLTSLLTPFGLTPLPPSAVEQGVRVRSPYDPLLSGTLTMDVHYHDLSLYPMWYQQGPSFYYQGSYSSSHGIVTAIEHQTNGYGILNATLAWRVGPNKDITIGIQGNNILNNLNPVTPCTAGSLGAGSPQLGVGCGPYWPLGGGTQPGANPNTLYSYASSAETGQYFLFFISKKF